VAVRSDKSHGKILAKRLLPIGRAAGCQGPDRNFRRLVAEQKVLWRIATAHCHLPVVWDQPAHAARSAGRTKPHVTELCQALRTTDTVYAGTTTTVRYSATSH